MTGYDDQDRRTLSDITPSGQEIRVGDPSPTLYDCLPDGRAMYGTGPEPRRSPPQPPEA